MPKKKAIEAVICPSKSDSVIISLGIIVSAKVSNQIYRHKQPNVDIVKVRLSIVQIAVGTNAVSRAQGVVPGCRELFRSIPGVVVVLKGIAGCCSKSFGEAPPPEGLPGHLILFLFKLFFQQADAFGQFFYAWELVLNFFDLYVVV